MAVKSGGRAILGLGFIATGGVFVWGGLTGRLAPMLAALVSPQDLAPSSGGSSTPGAGIPGTAKGLIPNLVVPGILSGGVIP